MAKRLTCLIVFMWFLTACQYEPPKLVVKYDYAFNQEGTHVAILVTRHHSHSPKGWAAWPSGGYAKITDQFLDVVIINLSTSTIENKHTISGPSLPFNPSTINAWLLGLQKQDFHLRVSGCGKSLPEFLEGCYPTVRKSVYYQNSVHYTTTAPPAQKKHKRLPDKSYLSLKSGAWWLVNDGKKVRLIVEESTLLP